MGMDSVSVRPTSGEAAHTVASLSKENVSEWMVYVRKPMWLCKVYSGDKHGLNYCRQTLWAYYLTAYKCLHCTVCQTFGLYPELCLCSTNSLTYITVQISITLSQCSYTDCHKLTTKKLHNRAEN